MKEALTKVYYMYIESGYILKALEKKPKEMEVKTEKNHIKYRILQREFETQKDLENLVMSSALKYYTIQWFNPFPNKPWCFCVCSTSLLKTLWEKDKLLVMSNLSFPYSVFYPFLRTFSHVHQI